MDGLVGIQSREQGCTAIKPVAVLMPLLTDLLPKLINLHLPGQDSEQFRPWIGINGVMEWNHHLKIFLILLI